MKTIYMNIKLSYTVVVFSLIGILMTGCSDSNASVESISTDLEVESSFEIDAWGEVKYNKEYQINIDFPARVESIETKEGDWVRKGDILAVLDVAEFDSIIEKLENSKIAGESVLSGTYQDTSGLEAKIAQTQKDIEIAQRDVNNYQTLYNNGSVSQDILNQYQSILTAQRTNLNILQVELDQLKKSNISNVDYKTNELHSIVKDLQTYLNKKDKEYFSENNIVCNLENAIVKSIYVKTGTLLGENNPIVIDLIDVDSIYISAEVEEEFIKYISMDSSVRIVPTMNSEQEFKGEIKQISAMAIEKDGNRIVKVQVVAEDPDHLLKPGYTADVYFQPSGIY